MFRQQESVSELFLDAPEHAFFAPKQSRTMTPSLGQAAFHGPTSRHWHSPREDVHRSNVCGWSLQSRACLHRGSRIFSFGICGSRSLALESLPLRSLDLRSLALESWALESVAWDLQLWTLSFEIFGSTPLALASLALRSLDLGSLASQSLALESLARDL